MEHIYRDKEDSKGCGGVNMWEENYVCGSDNLEELIRIADAEIERSTTPYRVVIKDNRGNIVYERVTKGKPLNWRMWI